MSNLCIDTDLINTQFSLYWTLLTGNCNAFHGGSDKVTCHLRCSYLSRWAFMPQDLSRQCLEIWRSIYQISVSRNIKKVSKAMVRNRGDVIRFSEEALWQTIQATFYSRRSSKCVWSNRLYAHTNIKLRWSPGRVVHEQKPGIASKDCSVCWKEDAYNRFWGCGGWCSLGTIQNHNFKCPHTILWRCGQVDRQGLAESQAIVLQHFTW